MSDSWTVLSAYTIKFDADDVGRTKVKELTTVAEKMKPVGLIDVIHVI